MAGKVIWGVLAALLIVIAVLIVIVMLRTFCLKPTSALTAKVKLDESGRSKEYGEKLAQMIRKETVSSRFDDDRTKFYEFHELLETLFPLVHKHCEKHVFDGQ